IGNEILLAVAHSDGTVIVRSRNANPAEWRERLRLKLTGASAVALTPDTSQILVARADGTICVFDSASGRQIQELVGHSGNVNDLRVTPDGETLASCGTDWTLRLWRRQGAQASWVRGPIQQRDNELLGMAMSPDG